MSSLAEFLLERIAEDEADARTAHRTDPECDLVFHGRVDPEFGWECTCGLPARVLAECEAKRQTVRSEQHRWIAAVEPDGFIFTTEQLENRLRKADTPVLRFLAAVYASHPDYRDEWKP